MRTTKIIATLGPATGSRDAIRKLVRAGVNVFRLNASHGAPEEHTERIRAVREVSDAEGEFTAALLDLQGPKIRLGTFEGGSCRLETGREFIITTESCQGNCSKASTSYSGLAKDVKPGDRILLADGSVELRVLSADGVEARCQVVSGGLIGDRKGINLPGANVSAPSLTRKDMADLQWALEAGVDLVALSFVRRAADIVRLKLYLEEKEKNLPVIAKIEKPEGWDNLDGIITECDGVMVARGDLGVEMALERVPFIQKGIIEQARQQGKFVIVATQMLESMIENPFPTRAEVSDIAGAIYDGADGVMLSAETSVGKYPAEAVAMMARIALEAEQSFRKRVFRPPPQSPNPSTAEIVADGAYHMACQAGVSAIVVFTATGFSARLIARFRPHVPVYAFTTSSDVARQLAIIYGVRPMLVPQAASTDEMLAQIDRMLRAQGAIKPGDSVVMVAGQPIGRPGSTNLIKLYQVS
jgi:pyruvate kinase